MQEGIDFFAEELAKYHTDANLFYLNDDEGGNDKMVFFSTSVQDFRKCVNVHNDSLRSLTVIPLDHNLKVKKENGSDEESICDYLISTDDREVLLFGEIKTGKKGWAKAGANQISNTLKVFKRFHNIDEWKKKIAYVSNRRFWKARDSHRDIVSEFIEKNNMLLKIQNDVYVE